MRTGRMLGRHVSLRDLGLATRNDFAVLR